MRITALYVFSFLNIFVFACQKDRDNVGSVTEAKITRSWNIDSIVVSQKFNGNESKVAYPGTESDYIEFRSDGNMYTKFQGNTNVSTFKVRDDQVITIGGDSASIIELSDNKFVLRTRAEAGSLGYLETTYHLSK